MGLPARDDDKIALGYLDFLPLSVRESRGALAQIVKQSVGARRQLKMPWMTELEVKEQRPTETNAIEHLGEYVHAAEITSVDDRTQHLDG